MIKDFGLGKGNDRERRAYADALMSDYKKDTATFDDTVAALLVARETGPKASSLERSFSNFTVWKALQTLYAVEHLTPLQRQITERYSSLAAQFPHRTITEQKMRRSQESFDRQAPSLSSSIGSLQRIAISSFFLMIDNRGMSLPEDIELATVGAPKLTLSVESRHGNDGPISTSLVYGEGTVTHGTAHGMILATTEPTLLNPAVTSPENSSILLRDRFEQFMAEAEAAARAGTL